MSTVTTSTETSLSDFEEPSNAELCQFLDLLEQDIKKNPKNIKAISGNLVDRVNSLVGDVDFDIALPLSDEDE